MGSVMRITRLDTKA